MWLEINKETKQIEGYISFSNIEPTPKEGCELVEVDEFDEVPADWQYSKWENDSFVLNELVKQAKLLEEKLNEIRSQREIECFSFINRGFMWYELLDDTQKEELKEWYQSWLDAPATLSIPNKPSWLK